MEACNGMNYLRAGEETTDPCLGRLLKELGEESYRQADQLMALERRCGAEKGEGRQKNAVPLFSMAGKCVILNLKF